MQLILRMTYTRLGVHVCGSMFVFGPTIAAGEGPLMCFQFQERYKAIVEMNF